MSSAQLQSPFTIRQAFVDAIRLVIHALDGGTPFPSGLAPADSSISHPTDPVPQLQWLTLETPIIAQGSFRFMIRDGPRWADRHIDHLFLPLETELRLAGQHLLALRDRARIWSMIRPIIQWLKAMARISQFFTRLSQLFPGNIRIVYSPNFHALVDQSFEAYKCLLLDDALYRRYWALGGLEFAPVHLHVHRLEVGEGWNVLWNDAYWHDRIPASIFEVESWTHAPMQRPSAPTDPNLHAVFTPTSQIDFSLIIEEDVYPEAAKPNPSASTSVPPNSGAVSERSPSVELIPDANVTPEMRTQCSSSGPSRKRRRVVDSDYESPYARSRSSSPPDPTISRNSSTTPEPPASPQKKKARRSRRTPTPQESSDDDDVPLRSRVSSASRFTRAQKRKGRAASPTPTLSEDEENDVKPLRKPKAKKPSASKSDKKMPGVLSLQSAKLALRAPLSDIDLPYIPPRPYTDSDHVQEPVSVNGVLLPKPADRERSILRRREYQQRNAGNLRPWPRYRSSTPTRTLSHRRYNRNVGNFWFNDTPGVIFDVPRIPCELCIRRGLPCLYEKGTMTTWSQKRLQCLACRWKRSHGSCDIKDQPDPHFRPYQWDGTTFLSFHHERLWLHPRDFSIVGNTGNFGDIL